jgi:hypothetical protein
MIATRNCGATVPSLQRDPILPTGSAEMPVPNVPGVGDLKRSGPVAASSLFDVPGPDADAVSAAADLDATGTLPSRIRT